MSVELTEISSPPQDGSSINYVLININSDIEDEIGTRYEYENVSLLEFTFKKSEDGVYSFLGQVFECANEVNCDSLIDLNNSGGAVNLSFEYRGKGRINLVQWN